MPLTRAAKRAAGAALPLTSPSTMAVRFGAVVDEVVEVAADGAGGEKADRHVGVGVRGRVGREQAELHLAGHGDVALQLALLAANGLVEARVFDGDGDLRGERGEHALVLLH